jgi:hypothetical protein
MRLFLFFYADGTLCFSSDGQAGMGGLDIFVADTAAGMWTNVRNMGYPLNTQNDDFGMAWDEDRKNGYFSSNRPGGKGGDDIYSFVNNYVTLKGIAFDKYTNKPIPGAEIRIPTRDKKVFANEKGEFAFEVPRSMEIRLTGDKHGYIQGQKLMETPSEGPVTLVRLPPRTRCTFSFCNRY